MRPVVDVIKYMVGRVGSQQDTVIFPTLSSASLMLSLHRLLLSKHGCLAESKSFVDENVHLAPNAPRSFYPSTTSTARGRVGDLGVTKV